MLEIPFRTVHSFNLLQQVLTYYSDVQEMWYY